MEEWNGFQGEKWRKKVDVEDFIINNYKEYKEDESFLVRSTKKTSKVWSRCQKLLEKERLIAQEEQRLTHIMIGASAENQEFLRGIGSSELSSGTTLADLLKRPEITYQMLAPLDPDRKALPDDVIFEAEINIKYEGYIKRQLRQVEQFKKMEEKKIPGSLDYKEVPSLRI